MPNFAQTIHRHLADYKTSRLGVKENGTYIHKGKERRYAHILPKRLQWLNILEPIRSEVRDYLKHHPNVKLHRYFHHLNSSQAFALNLFFPYFEQGAPLMLLRAMGMPGEFSDWRMENIAEASEGTNVDIMWFDSEGKKTFCEVKLSEQEFGVAKNDFRHRQKLEEVYSPVLTGQCAPDLLVPSEFFAHYQLLRNVWLAAREPNSSVVFLAPRTNFAIWSQLERFRTKLHDPLKQRVHAIAVEDVLVALTSSKHNPPHLRWYATLLQEKYLISNGST